MLLDTCFKKLDTCFKKHATRYISFIYVAFLLSFGEFVPQEKKLTDRLIKKAYNECKSKPFIPAASLADRLGFNARYMTRELVALVKADKFEMIKIGNMFLFRPK